MSLFPRSFGSNDTSFHPLFRLLDDFDTYRSDSGAERQNRSNVKSFVPKFDVSEHGESYELHGELPGIEQKDIEIEFSDRQTLVIRGHTERSYTSGATPAGSIEGSKTQGAIEGDKASSAAKENGSAKNDNEVATHEKKSHKSDIKYWVSERSVGHFSRSFNFPTPVDQDAVQASLKNGILSVTIPKAKKPESRKITIS